MDGTVFRIIEGYIIENEILEREEICQNTTLDETGMDSLDIIEFVMEIEKRTGLLVDDVLIDNWTRKTTLGEICRDIIYG